ncbi:glycosyltransferase [Deinococcus sp. SDU3-2]|uniref:Glycosyltransferase n=1 Tax=Deinococcus terrestris TaxID=2651870 RepID=A0A7X1NXI8_9DEIO|nr:glycosyltransferase [Deinococcus terrestris]MPY67637.1 glycosyltransferase [Deinococcus terrestris]
MKNVCAIVVTYNRQASLEKCIQAIRSQSYPTDILVVDNASTDGTPKYIKEMYPEISLIQLDENLGGAGGFSAGVKYARDHLSADWYVLLDDDAFMHHDCVLNMVSYMNDVNYAHSVLISRLIDDASYFEAERGAMPVDKGTFVGFFISSEMVGNIGEPKGDYFIYWDDAEYSYRAKNASYGIYRVGESIIEHKDWSGRGQLNIRYGPVKFNYTPLAGWRTYYLIRNRFLCDSDSGHSMWKAGLSALKYLLKTMLVKPSNTVIVLKAMLHGVTGRRGKLISP